jgi:hypothetical protein
MTPEAALYIDEVDCGWDLSLRDIANGYPHLTGAVRAM